jgi:hypothetical protein
MQRAERKRLHLLLFLLLTEGRCGSMELMLSDLSL